MVNVNPMMSKLERRTGVNFKKVDMLCRISFFLLANCRCFQQVIVLQLFPVIPTIFEMAKLGQQCYPTVFSSHGLH